MNGPNNYNEWDEEERNRKPPSFKGPKIDKETGDPGPRKPPKMDRTTGKVVAPTSDVKSGAVKDWLANKGAAAADIFSKAAAQRKESMSGLNPTATYGDSGETKATLLSDEPLAYAKGLKGKQETYDEWLKKQRTT